MYVCRVVGLEIFKFYKNLAKKIMRDIHKKEFDDGTIIKLEILRRYVREWLPVFLRKNPPGWQRVFLYDFFAGEGMDLHGNPGSPLIILEELKPYCGDIKQKGIQVEIFLMSYAKRKSTS